MTVNGVEVGPAGANVDASMIEGIMEDEGVAAEVYETGMV